MRRTKTTGEGWDKVASKHFRHTASGAEVKYNHNRFLWEIVEGPGKGEAYVAKWIAFNRAAKTPAQWA